MDLFFKKKSNIPSWFDDIDNIPSWFGNTHLVFTFFRYQTFAAVAFSTNTAKPAKQMSRVDLMTLACYTELFYISQA